MALRKVLMIDDHAMVREGTRLLFAQQDLACDLVEAGSWTEARRLLDGSSDFDWVLLDLALPDVDGMLALAELRGHPSGVPVVVLSSTEDRAVVLECINRGAMGFIAKASSGAVLADALRVVFAGGVYLPPAILGKSSPPREPAQAVMAATREELTRLGLTPRQIEVLELMVQGLSNKLIAKRLQLAEPTVKTHVAAGLRALNVKNRTQAVFALAKWRPGQGPLAADHE
ncbi:MAG: LuxR family transcriptional regulator [Polyangiaceae bacterium]|jgi:DNA-binding NarL/FixJ family response regulator|nr:LuxR family transcriptional regulator [Polyangiaceae bacterium]